MLKTGTQHAQRRFPKDMPAKEMHKYMLLDLIPYLAAIDFDQPVKVVLRERVPVLSRLQTEVLKEQNEVYMHYEMDITDLSSVPLTIQDILIRPGKPVWVQSKVSGNGFWKVLSENQDEAHLVIHFADGSFEFSEKIGTVIDLFDDEPKHTSFPSKIRTVKEILELQDLDHSTPEGKLVLAAIAYIMQTVGNTDKSPDEVLATLISLTEGM